MIDQASLSLLLESPAGKSSARIPPAIPGPAGEVGLQGSRHC
jgi:hypothetical protein